jgi:hypothetical protein
MPIAAKFDAKTSLLYTLQSSEYTFNDQLRCVTGEHTHNTVTFASHTLLQRPSSEEIRDAYAAIFILPILLNPPPLLLLLHCVCQTLQSSSQGKA